MNTRFSLSHWVAFAAIGLLLACMVEPRLMLAMRFVGEAMFSGRSDAKVWYGLGYVIAVALCFRVALPPSRPWLHGASLLLVLLTFAIGVATHFWLSQQFNLRVDDIAIYYQHGTQTTSQLAHNHVGKASLAFLLHLVGVRPHYGYDSGWPWLDILPPALLAAQTAAYMLAVAAAVASLWHARIVSLRWFLPFALAVLAVVKVIPDGGFFSIESIMAWPVFVGVQLALALRSKACGRMVAVQVAVALAMFGACYATFVPLGVDMLEHGADLLLCYVALYGIGWCVEKQQNAEAWLVGIVAIYVFALGALVLPMHRFYYEKMAYPNRMVTGEFVAWVPARTLQKPGWPWGLSVKESYPLGREVLIYGTVPQPMKTLALSKQLGLNPSVDYIMQPGDAPRTQCRAGKTHSMYTTAVIEKAPNILPATVLGKWMEVHFKPIGPSTFEAALRFSECLPDMYGSYKRALRAMGAPQARLNFLLPNLPRPALGSPFTMPDGPILH